MLDVGGRCLAYSQKGLYLYNTPKTVPLIKEHCSNSFKKIS